MSEHPDKSPDIAVMFEVHYDTPSGDVCMKVTGFTDDAQAHGVKCQIGYRPSGEAEQRSEPMSLDDVMEIETKAAVLDGEALYLRIVDATGRDLAVSKIDEVKWPRDASPTTVQTKAYWLNVPSKNLA